MTTETGTLGCGARSRSRSRSRSRLATFAVGLSGAACLVTGVFACRGPERASHEKIYGVDRPSDERPANPHDPAPESESRSESESESESEGE